MWRRFLNWFFSRPLRQHWRAISPSSQVELGFLTEDEAFNRACKLGTVSYIDREYCVIFFSTQLGLQQSPFTG